MVDGKINDRQLFFMMFWTILSTAILALPVIIGKYAPRDAWMDAILFIPMVSIAAWLAADLGNKFPQQTIIQYSEVILGRWLGKLVSAILILWLIHSTSLMYREIGEFTILSLLPGTPLTAIFCLISIPPAYATYHGLEVIGRMADFLFFICFFFIIIIYILLIPEYHFKELLPLFSDGIGNILRPLPIVTSFGAQVMIVLFFFPSLKTPQNSGRTLLALAVILGVMGMMTEATHTMIFGLDRKVLNLTFYQMARYVNIGGILERMDPLFVIGELLGSFIKITVFTYVSVFSVAQLFQLKNYRILILPIVAVIFFLALYGFGDLPQMMNFLMNMVPLYSLPIQYGIPLLLLIVGRIRRIS